MKKVRYTPGAAGRRPGPQVLSTQPIARGRTLESLSDQESERSPWARACPGEEKAGEPVWPTRRSQPEDGSLSPRISGLRLRRASGGGLVRLLCEVRERHAGGDYQSVMCRQQSALQLISFLVISTPACLFSGRDASANRRCGPGLTTAATGFQATESYPVASTSTPDDRTFCRDDSLSRTALELERPRQVTST